MTSAARLLALVAAGVFLVVGIPWYVRPEWSADRFPWGVSPMVAMTIGAWSLGNAWWSWCAARPRPARDARALWAYLLAFGVLELAVVVWFADKLRTEEWMTWPYLASLVLAALAGATGLLAGDQGTEEPAPDEPAVPPWASGFVWFFVVFVGFLALVAFWAPARARSGIVFPEPMTLFTLRAFGAFYLSLASGAAVLLPARRASAFAAYGVAGLGLVALITATVVAYADRFDIGDHPLQVLYIVAYVGVLVVDVAGLVWYRRQRSAIRSAPGTNP
jgi:hypothetical protein